MDAKRRNFLSLKLVVFRNNNPQKSSTLHPCPSQKCFIFDWKICLSCKFEWNMKFFIPFLTFPLWKHVVYIFYYTNFFYQNSFEDCFANESFMEKGHNIKLVFVEMNGWSAFLSHFFIETLWSWLQRKFSFWWIWWLPFPFFYLLYNQSAS